METRIEIRKDEGSKGWYYLIINEEAIKKTWTEGDPNLEEVLRLLEEIEEDAMERRKTKRAEEVRKAAEELKSGRAVLIINGHKEELDWIEEETACLKEVKEEMQELSIPEWIENMTGREGAGFFGLFQTIADYNRETAGDMLRDFLDEGTLQGTICRMFLEGKTKLTEDELEEAENDKGAATHDAIFNRAWDIRARLIQQDGGLVWALIQ